MTITNNSTEFKKLRSYLNPFIKGHVTDAVLNALATASSYLINNVSAVNDSLYIVSASGQYLDQRLAEFGITRPPQIGLSDDIFRQIGIAVKNRKQVRDLINEILDFMFGDEYVKAFSASAKIEPYALTDGDTLIVNFDERETVTVTFNTDQFENIAAATAQEVADAIAITLNNANLTGTAISENIGNGNYVVLLSSTIGPVSSVTVQGGSAQNQLMFAAPVSAGGNSSTQWTLSIQNGGFIRYTWTGGANPNVGRLTVGNYVIVNGGGFASSSNVGSYPITAVVGGVAGSAYFQVYNPLGSPGVVVQGSDTAVMFYNPVRRQVNSRTPYAAVYQTQGRVLQIFMPASTQVIRRGRIGSAHLHDPPRGTFTFSAQPNPDDTFSIDTTNNLVAGADFAIGANTQATIVNLVAAINLLPGLDATANTGEVLVFNDSLSNILTIAYTGSANIVASGPQGYNISLEPNQLGPYIYDLTQPFTLNDVQTTLVDELDATKSRVVPVVNSSEFPDAQGYVIIGYGTAEQEGPIPYIARPSDSTILISPAYTIQNLHPAGSNVNMVAYKGPIVLNPNGTDYPFYITDVASGREYAQSLINSVAAIGIAIVFTVLYPGDKGLGKWGTPYSEIVEIWS